MGLAYTAVSDSYHFANGQVCAVQVEYAVVPGLELSADLVTQALDPIMQVESADSMPGLATALLTVGGRMRGAWRADVVKIAVIQALELATAYYPAGSFQVLSIMAQTSDAAADLGGGGFGIDLGAGMFAGLADSVKWAAIAAVVLILYLAWERAGRPGKKGE